MKFTLLLIIIVLSSNSWSTAQISDLLIFEGEEIRLHVNPLEKFYERYPDRRLKGLPASTALWRGYIATFGFDNGELVLREMESQEWDEGRSIEVSIIEKAFPTKTERKLDWYSGVLVCPRGKLVNYVHLGYASEFEKYTVFIVKNGKLDSYKKFTLRGYKKYKWKQFKAFKKTDEYTKVYDEIESQIEGDEKFDIEKFIYQSGGYTNEFIFPFK